MGVFARALKAGVGWPAVGWAPPYGTVTDSIATTVNQRTAMGVGAFTAGIRLIAEDLASLPLITYRYLPTGGKERAREHPAYRLLHDSPNPEMTSMVFRETGVAHMYSWGNWFAEQELNGNGTTARLWPLRPDRMKVEIVSGRRVYKYDHGNGTGTILPARNVFHVPGWGFDGLVGYSRVTLMRRALESAIVTSEYGLRTLANGARPGVTLLTDKQLGKEAKTNIVESWDETHSGLTNTQRTAILDEGMTIEHTGFSPEDAQYLDSRKFSTIEVSQGLRLAPHKLSDLENAHFTNIEESNIDYVVSITPTAHRIDQQINKDIIGDPNYFAEHLMDGLNKGRLADRIASEVQLRQNGLATDDELRALENRNPLTDEQRQHLLIPLNSVPASAYDENGMTANQRGLLVAALVHAGYDPTAALSAYGLPDIPHTGFLPATVQTEPLLGEKADDEMVTGLKAAIRSLSEPPVVNVEAPVVNVAASEVPVVNVHTDSFVDAIDDLKAMLSAPVERVIVRDPKTKAIIGTREVRGA